MRIAALLVAAALGGGALVAPTAHAADPPPVKYTTVEKLYGPKPVLQKLTVYVPTTPGKKPTILFVHGGCWARGYLMDAEKTLAQQIVQRTGYVVAVMTYREDDPKYQNQPSDLSAALHVLQTTSGLKVDPTRVALWGESAGAQLALLKAYKSTGAPGVDRPAAVVSVSGVADMKTAYSSSISKCVADFEDGAPTTSAMMTRYDQTSGIKFVNSTDPATFIAHATGDPRVPYDQSLKLNQKLALSSVSHQFVSVSGQHHATAVEYDVPAGQTLPVYQLAIRFLQAHFQPPH
jgi:acetyl esterase/lipase